jgi:hypothetical protein
MKRNLPNSISSFLIKKSIKSYRFLVILLLVLNFGLTTKTNAQCIGPYQVFESCRTKGAIGTPNTMADDGWVFGGTANTGSNATNSRSGLTFITLPTITQYVVTPKLAHPDKFHFYHRTSTLTRAVNGLIEWSTDPTFTVGVFNASFTTGTTTAYSSSGVIDLSAFTDVYVRISSVSYVTTAAAIFIDDISWTSRTASENIVIVPDTVPAPGAITDPYTCNAVTVPAAGTGTYSFYDQGGNHDTFKISRTQTLYFAPTTPGEKVKFTFNSFAVNAVTNITVYNGNGPTGGTEFVGLNAANTVAGGTSVTSTDASGYITVRFVTSGTAPVVANTGFDITVECVGDPTISGLSGSGCVGGQLVISGNNLIGATAVTVGGTAVSSIVSNTNTVLTVVPAPGSSGTVQVTTAVNSTTSVATYTVNAVPTISSQPSSGTQIICLNGAATALSVTAAAGSGTIQNYQWFSNTSATTVGATLVATNTTAATTDTYMPLTTSTGTLYYYVIVTNSNGCTVTSGFTGAIDINAPVVIATPPSITPQSACVGGAITALSVVATGGGLGYQWYSNAVNSNVGGTLIVGETTSTYTPSNLSPIATTYYYCVVSNGAPCSSSVTSAVSGGITVNALPTVVTVGTAGTYCTDVTLTATNGGSGTIYFQGTTSNGIDTTKPGTSQLVSASGTYYFRAYDGTCWGPEGSVAITILAVPVAPTATAATLITANSFSVNWNAVAGATNYFLDVATDAGFTALVGIYSNLSVGNVITRSVTGLSPTTTYYYRVRANNGFCSGPSSVSANITTLGLTYCTPSVPATNTTYINNFTTTGGITNISNLATGFTVGGYANYAAQSCSQYPSSSVNYSIGSVRSDSADQTFFYYIWVDWNNDGDFLDAGETMLATTGYTLSPRTGSFAVPAGLSAGNYRMRVSTSWVGANTSCTHSASGRAETEDYTFTVVPVPPCAPSTPSGLTSSGIFATGATISWTDAAMTPNSIYNYFYSTSATAPLVGTTPSGSVVGGLSANLTGLTLGSTYYFWVRSNCGAPNAWVGSSNFTTVNVDIINMNNGSISTCNARFYDSGGSAGAYTNNENYTYTVSPSSAGSKLKVVFNSFGLENNYDYLSIYNGTTAIPANLIGTYTGVQIAAGQTFYSTAAGGELTFVFTSDISAVLPGWDALITCVSVPAISSFTPTNVCAGATPTVTITGLNFTGATSVKFNGVDATSFTVVSPTSITAVLPAGVTTGYITISNAQSTGVSTTLFVINPLPITPNAGADVPLCIGNSVTLSGSTPPVNTVVLSETFNSGAWPSGWSRTINGGYSPGDFRTSFEATSTGNTWAGNGYTGYCSYFYSYLLTTGVTGDMISPIIDLSSFSASNLSFWIYNNAGTDALRVYANNNGGAYTQVGATYSSYGAWTQITISLNAYSGAGFNTVRIKFTGTSDGALSSNIGVDDILVTGDSVPTILWSPATGLSATNIVTPVANPTINTTYTLTSSYASGCSASDTVVVTVNPKPTVSIPTAAASICANSVVAVTSAGTATNYTWTSSVANTLFTDATGSTAYVPGSNASTIYVKTPATAVITLTGTVLPSGCSDTANVTFTVSTKTFNSGFWTPGGPPVNDGTENIVFNAGTYTSTGNLSACSCSVTGATVTIASGHTLTLVNGLTVSSGSMTFNNSASLIQINDITNTGNIVYRRNTAMKRYDYTYWSSPVSPQTLANLSPLTLSDKYFWWNPAAGIYNWATVTAPALTSMTQGQGYIIRAPQFLPDLVTPWPTTSEPFVGSFSGVPNNGDYTVSIVKSASGDFNLIGNPYPSAIDADAFITGNAATFTNGTLGTTLYFWTHNTPITANSYFFNDYALYNFTGATGVGTVAPNSGNNNNPAPRYIAAGQAFMIKGVNVGSFPATFRNTMRVAGSNTFFFRQSGGAANTLVSVVENLERNRIWLDLKNSDGAYKQILVGYIQNATNAFENGYDGEVVEAENPVGLYSLVSDKKLVIQGRALPFDSADQVPLGLFVTTAGTYEIALSDFDGLFEDESVGIYLEDTLLNVIHDLRQGSYSFVSETGTFDARFVLRYTTSLLSVTSPVFSENDVVVFKQNDAIHIQTSTIPMLSVQIFDVRGRLVLEQKNINNEQVVFENLNIAQQVLVVQITAIDGTVVNKKIIF